MKTLTQLAPNPNRKPLTSDEILNLAPESLSESLLLKELVRVLKAEIKEKLISDISHQLR